MWMPERIIDGSGHLLVLALCRPSSLIPGTEEPQVDTHPDPVSINDFTVVVGLDVGKTSHYAWAGTGPADTDRLFAGPLPNQQTDLEDLYARLAVHGRVLVVVDQPSNIGSLAVATALNQGIEAAYLPGYSMRAFARFKPGSSKTDRRDAKLIAQAAWAGPDALRRLKHPQEMDADIAMLSGFDQDLAAQATATSNRIQGIYTHIHPALGQALSAHLDHPAVVALIGRYPTPAMLRKAGRSRVQALLKKHGCHRHAAWTNDIFTALDAQTITIPGASSQATVLSMLATSLATILDQRARIEAELTTLLDDHPLYQVLTSMPGIGVRTAAVILAEVTGRSFPTGAAFSAYAGLTPTTRQSGTSLNSTTASRGGNKRLKRAMFLSAFAALRHDPASRAYYDRKRAQGKHHNAAVIALAHRRALTLYAMIRDGALYDPPTRPAHTLAA